MHGELVRIQTDDGIELAGIFAAPQGGVRDAVLHVHGYAGTFYENRFVSAIGEALVGQGVGLLAANNRGHDYVADNLRGTGRETEIVPGGAAYDLFEKTIEDIDACAAFLRSRGVERIWYEGHSLGTLRIVHYLDRRGAAAAQAIILISPPDMFGLIDARTDGETEAVLEDARRFVAEGRGGTLMAAGRDHPVSAASLVSLYGDPGLTDIFPVRLGDEGDYGRIEKLEVPALVTMGDVEEAVTIRPDDAARLVASHMGGQADCVVIEGANHVYWGHEDELAGAVSSFVRDTEGVSP